MNVRPVEAGPPPMNRRWRAHGERRALVGERRDAEAQRLLGEARPSFPTIPGAARARAAAARGGDAAARERCWSRSSHASPAQLPFWLSLAAVLRSARAPRGGAAGARARAWRWIRRIWSCCCRKARCWIFMNKPRSAAAVYGHALQTLAPGTPLPPGRSRRTSGTRRSAWPRMPRAGRAPGSRLAALRRTPAIRRSSACASTAAWTGCSGGAASTCLSPRYMLFPYLETTNSLTARTSPGSRPWRRRPTAIRDELLGVLEQAIKRASSPTSPSKQGCRSPMARAESLATLGRVFPVESGTPRGGASGALPANRGDAAAVPQVDIPGRGPTAFFSILDAAHEDSGAHRRHQYSPHRAPALIVPPGCRFRVGGETREWRVGTAWVFDDTIEHEAWNDSDAPRAILIFDVWNPSSPRWSAISCVRRSSRSRRTTNPRERCRAS
jgi:aspartate beta-hydroxylase